MASELSDEDLALVAAVGFRCTICQGVPVYTEVVTGDVVYGSISCRDCGAGLDAQLEVAGDDPVAVAESERHPASS